MAQQKSPAPDSGDTPPSSDPWQAVSYLLSGVLVYGLAGWGLDRWLGTTWIVAVGIIVGAGLGIWMTWLRSGGGARAKKNVDE
jgi:F0F1-type ATP synthase assembly protein I